jgi:hypothetical protein
VSAEQRDNLDAIFRQSAFPADADVGELRRQLAALTSAQPLPAGVRVTAAALGGVPAGARKVLLDEAAAALDRAGQLLTAHLASAQHATA